VKNPDRRKRLLFPTSIALLACVAVSLFISWTGPVAINFFGRGIIVTGIWVPCIFVAAVWLTAVIKPGLVTNRVTVSVFAAVLASMIIYGEVTLSPLPGLTSGSSRSTFVPGRFRDFNVLLISLDTLRADHLGIYGCEFDTSPAIDSFAASATTFTGAQSAAPATLISHSTMFTGLHPGAHRGQFGTRTALPGSAVTLAETLRDAGYSTAGFCDGAQLSAVFGTAQGFETYNDAGGGIKDIWPRARDWLAAHEDDRFFLFLHCYDIHLPYEPPPPFDTMFYPDYNGPLPRTIPAAVIDRISKGRLKITGDDLRHIVSVYDGGIRYTDSYMGEVLRYLDHQELDDRTIVIVTSDHGEELGEHGAVGVHAHTLFNELLEVPLIIRLPGVSPGRVGDRVGLVDLPPTLFDLLEIPYDPESYQGASFARTFGEDHEAGGRRAIFAEKEHLVFEKYGRLKSITAGDWKYISFTSDPLVREAARILGSVVWPIEGKKLFNLKTDPMEQHNLIGEHIQLGRSLEETIILTMQSNKEFALPVDKTPLRIDPEQYKRLKKLGYFE